MTGTLSVYVRGSISLPCISPNHITTLDRSPEGQISRLKPTDAPEVPVVVATPKHTSLPFSYNSTEPGLPTCGSGADFKGIHQKMAWKATNLHSIFDLVVFARGVIL
ncbi:hypothetical protein BDM02DRAFT_1281943 [Thelephora ganbajun]|uniref:Uncharacterized protein n=1 Tax=Thelephora ganbajun TaxID=370292 RepID=A0ACB6Z2V8_THEGA|nr:hypothetical protein BDM02DRAFT_1281943 [Thelephora ganbajun]